MKIEKFLARKYLHFWISGVVGLVICFEVNSYLKKNMHRIEDPRYLVARQQIPAGSTIQFLDFTIQHEEDLSGGRPQNSVTDQEWHRLRNRRLKTDLDSDGVLTWDNLESDKPGNMSQWIPKGFRAYAIVVANAAHIFPGDRVDVLQDPSRKEEGVTVVVESAVVLRRETTELGAHLVLSLTPEDVRQVEEAKRRGQLTVSLRNPEDREERNVNSPRAKKKLQGIEIFSESER